MNFGDLCKILLASSRLMETPMVWRECRISAASILPDKNNKQERKWNKQQNTQKKTQNIAHNLCVFNIQSASWYRPSLFLSRLLNMILSSFSCARRYCVNSSKSRAPSWLVSPSFTIWNQTTSVTRNGCSTHGRRPRPHWCARLTDEWQKPQNQMSQNWEFLRRCWCFLLFEWHASNEPPVKSSVGATKGWDSHLTLFKNRHAGLRTHTY